jgi:ATP-dependent Clp protease ATP-binding subunit ClpC
MGIGDKISNAAEELKGKVKETAGNATDNEELEADGEELKQHFKPEFLNRVDDVVVFPQLSRAEIVQIVDLEVAKLSRRLHDRDMTLELTQSAKDLLAEKGYDPVLGARPLRRTIQRDIEDSLSERILFGQIQVGDEIVVDAEGEGLLGDLTFARRGADGGLEPISDTVDVESMTRAGSDPAAGRSSARGTLQGPDHGPRDLVLERGGPAAARRTPDGKDQWAS